MRGVAPASLVLVSALAALAALMPDAVWTQAAASSAPSGAVRVNVDSAGFRHPGELTSAWSQRFAGGSAVSADGNRVAFATAQALVPGDTNGTTDVYLRDMSAGRTLLVSASSSGAAAGDSGSPSMSADGTRVAFESESLLLPGATCACWRTLVREVVTGRTTVVSTTAQGLPATGVHPVISGDGGTVMFTSGVNLFDPRTVPCAIRACVQVYVRGLDSGDLEMVSVDNFLRPSEAPAYSGALSFDGSKVVFLSESAMAPGSGSQDCLSVLECYTVWWRDRVTGDTRLAAPGWTGDRTGASKWPSVSADGMTVAFHTEAWDLGPGVGERGSVAVWSAATGEIVAIEPANGHVGCAAPDLDPSGRYLLWETSAALTPGDAEDSYDIHLRDLHTGELTLLAPVDCDYQAAADVTMSADASTLVLRSRDPGWTGRGDGVDDLFALPVG